MYCIPCCQFWGNSKRNIFMCVLLGVLVLISLWRIQSANTMRAQLLFAIFYQYVWEINKRMALHLSMLKQPAYISPASVVPE